MKTIEKIKNIFKTKNIFDDINEKTEKIVNMQQTGIVIDAKSLGPKLKCATTFGNFYEDEEFITKISVYDKTFVSKNRNIYEKCKNKIGKNVLVKLKIRVWKDGHKTSAIVDVI